MRNQPRTAVIGAGISGLTASKMLGDYGVPYTCFEGSDRIGGNWAFGNPNGHSSAYRSLHIDTSKHRLSFKDFPMPEEYPDFPHHTQIKDYLDGYADTFDLRENIEFSNGVEHAEHQDGGGWELRLQDGSTREFDVLVVANGHHWDPRSPDFPGEFTGESIHSHHYIDPTEPLDLHDKSILVVGIGNSAADIAVELSSKSLSNRVTLEHAVRRLDRAEVHRRAPRRQVLRDLAVRLARLPAQADPVLPAAHCWPPRALRAAHPEPQVLRSPPDAVGGTPAAARLRRHHGQDERLPAGRNDGALRGRHRHRRRRDRLRDGLQHHLPVLRPRVPERAGQRDQALQAHPQARHGRHRVRRVRAGHPDALPVRRVPGAHDRRLRRRATTARRRSPRWNGSSPRTSGSTSVTSSTARAIRSRSTTSSTSTTCAPANYPPAGSAHWPKARCGWVFQRDQRPGSAWTAPR